MQEGHTFAIAVPILTETIFGFSLLSRAAENLAEWSRLRETLPCFIPDEEDAYLAAELQVSLRRRGRQLGTVDALIAATALHHNLLLLTTDKDFDAVPDLQRENWLPTRRIN
jgi:tRNA(fMet)-specific endonuclease VapC